jgi:hypothetical protein
LFASYGTVLHTVQYVQYYCMQKIQKSIFPATSRRRNSRLRLGIDIFSDITARCSTVRLLHCMLSTSFVMYSTTARRYSTSAEFIGHLLYDTVQNLLRLPSSPRAKKGQMRPSVAISPCLLPYQINVASTGGQVRKRYCTFLV